MPPQVRILQPNADFQYFLFQHAFFLRKAEKGRIVASGLQ
jgi:hypothetical protein